MRPCADSAAIFCFFDNKLCISCGDSAAIGAEGGETGESRESRAEREAPGIGGSEER
jgi:hypothetical protein